jgi:hypothetical protein
MRPPLESPSAPPSSSAYSTTIPLARIEVMSDTVFAPGSPVACAVSGSGAPSVCSTSYLGIPQPGQLGNFDSRALDYRIGPDDHFVPIDVRLLRASEFEACAAASLNRFPATIQEGRSGRSQPLGKPCGVGKDRFGEPNRNRTRRVPSSAQRRPRHSVRSSRHNNDGRTRMGGSRWRIRAHRGPTMHNAVRNSRR